VDARELRKLLARNVRIVARRRKLALTALADFAGVSRSQMFAVLAGSTSPTIDWLAKIASALDIEPSQLLAPLSSVKRETSR